MSIMRAQLPRELQANGGITQIRQPYFIGKLVRKVTKPFKKIVKSPVGKAAALYGLGTMLGGMPAFGGTGQLSFFDKLKNPALLKNLITPTGWSEGNVLNTLLRKNIAEEGAKKAVWGGFSPFKLAAAAATAAPFAAPKIDETESLSEEVTDVGEFDFDYKKMISELQAAIQTGEQELVDNVLAKYNLSRADMPPLSSLQQTAAEGGRIGLYRGGSPADSHNNPSRGGWSPGAGRDDSGYQPNHPQHGGGGGWDPGAGRPQYIPPTPKEDSYLVRESKKVPGFLANVGIAKKLNIPYLMAAYGRDFLQDQWNKRDEGSTITPSNTYQAMGPFDFIGNLFSKDKAEDKAEDKTEDITDVDTIIDVNPYADPNINPARDQSLGTGLLENTRKDIMSAVDQGTQKLIESGVLDELRKQGLAVGYAQGGRIGMQEGGIMDLGGMEKDYRNTGGFVEIGGKEKADDVPARLSKNEFVFTADAVRSAGGGDIDKGAEIMENVMKNLEAGGKISEESQGMRGAQEMFDVSERLSEVI